MNPRLIANPPIGIYSNPATTINHAAFLVLLDAVARYRSELNGEKIVFPGRSYNFYGRRGDALLRNDNESRGFEELSQIHRKNIMDDIAREKLNLSSLELLTDDEPVIQKGVQRDIVKLYEKGFVIEKDNELYLDCRKIVQERDLKEMLDEIKVRPERINTEILRLIEQNTSLPLLITRQTRYSLKNPLGGDNIGPLFVLANMWDHRYPSHDITLAGSDSVLTKYVFLRLMTRAALDDYPGMDELIIWPKIIPEGRIEEWDLENLVSNEYEGDMVRCSILSCYTEREQKVFMGKDRFVAARNFVYLVSNLRKVLKGSFSKSCQTEVVYSNKLENFDFQDLIRDSRIRLKQISANVNTARDNGVWNEQLRRRLASEYIATIFPLSPIIPATIKSVKGDFRND